MTSNSGNVYVNPNKLSIISNSLLWVLEIGYKHYSSNILPDELIEYAKAPLDNTTNPINLNVTPESPASRSNDIQQKSDDVLLDNDKISEWLLINIIKFQKKIDHDNISVESPGTFDKTKIMSNIPLHESKLFLTKTKLQNGLIKYVVNGNFNAFQVANIGEIIDDQINEIIGILKIIDYISNRELVININKFPTVKYDLFIEYETSDQHKQSNLIALKEWHIIAKHMLEHQLKQDVEQLIQISNDFSSETSYKFRVMGPNAQPIYVSKVEYAKITISLKLEQYYGWRYLGSNGLVELVLSKFKNVNAKLVNGIYIIPFNRQYKNISNLVPSMVTSLILDNNISFKLPRSIVADNDTFNLVMELLKRFGYKIVETNRKSDNYIAKLLPGAYKCPSLSEWIIKSIPLIIQNQLPYVLIQCEYPEYWSVQSSRSIQDRKVMVYYMALQAYSRLIQKFPYLSTSIYRINVNDDMSIEIPVSSKDELNIFKQNMSIISSDFNPAGWNTFKVDNLREVVIYRWILYHKYNVNSIAFEMYSDNTNKYLQFNNVITKERRILNNMLSQSGTNTSQIRIEKYTDDIIYYIITDMHIDPSQYSNVFNSSKHINKQLFNLADSIKSSFNMSNINASYDDLLNIIMNNVPIIDLGDDGSRISLQMINRNVFMRSAPGFPINANPESSSSDQSITPIISFGESKRLFNIFVNPNTQHPISRESVSRILMYEYGLLGWFDIGGNIEGHTPQNTIFIPGLEKYPPTRYLNKLKIGRIKSKALLSRATFRNEFIISIEVDVSDSYQCNFNTQSKNTDSSDLANNSSSSYISSKSNDNLNTGLIDSPVSNRILEPEGPFGKAPIDSGMIKLFDIAYDRIFDKKDNKDNTNDLYMKIYPDEIRFMTQINNSIAWLWKKGWFLSLWTTAIVHANDTEIFTCADKSYAYPLDDVLKAASQSAASGKIAIYYLNLIVQSI